MLMLACTADEKADGVTVRSLELDSHTQYYVTAASGDPVADFSTVAEVVAERQIESFQEKIYGLAGPKDEILGLRKAQYSARGLDATLPVTYVDGTPLSSGKYAGVQLWGFGGGGKGGGVSTVRLPGLTPGRSWQGAGVRLVYLPNLRGLERDGQLARSPTDQAKRMFANARIGLQSMGMSYRQVMRTWIYLARVLDWYGEFNRVRTEFHAREGMVRKGHNSIFPASTGIQGRGGGAEECFMDLLAIDICGDAEVQPVLGSRRQPPAFTYGAGFSRAVVLTLEKSKVVFVSGTASTDAAGEVVHRGRPEAQCLETLLSISAILQEQGGSLDDICMSTLFCKTPQVYEAYNNVNQLLGLNTLPTVAMLADVCRPEWLVEIEAVAIIRPGWKNLEPSSNSQTGVPNR